MLRSMRSPPSSILSPERPYPHLIHDVDQCWSISIPTIFTIYFLLLTPLCTHVTRDEALANLEAAASRTREMEARMGARVREADHREVRPWLGSALALQSGALQSGVFMLPGATSVLPSNYPSGVMFPASPHF